MFWKSRGVNETTNDVFAANSFVFVSFCTLCMNKLLLLLYLLNWKQINHSNSYLA